MSSGSMADACGATHALVVGLVISRYVAPDPVALMPALRAQTELRLGRSVRLVLEREEDRLAGPLGAVRLSRAGRVLTLTPAVPRFDGRAIARAREQMAAIGAERVLGLRALRFRFRDAPPSLEQLAAALEMPHVVPGRPWALLRSGWRTPVEIEIDARGFELQAPILIFGKLFEASVAAADAIASPVRLTSPRA